MGVFTGDAFWGNAAALRFSGVSRVLCRRADSQPARRSSPNSSTSDVGYVLTVAGRDGAVELEQIAFLPTSSNPRIETGIIKVEAIGMGQACCTVVAGRNNHPSAKATAERNGQARETATIRRKKRASRPAFHNVRSSFRANIAQGTNRT